MEQFLLTFGIGLAFFFAFVSGVHDGGNLIASSVLSRALTPRSALALATGAVFAGPLLYGSAVVLTLRDVLLESTMLKPSNAVPLCLFLVSGVASASLWNLLTWWVGKPSGSSYPLLGGLLGGAAAAFGFEMIHASTLLCKVILFLLLCPVLGAVLARLGMTMKSLFENDENPSPLRPEGKGGGGNPGARWRLVHDLSLLLEGMGHGANNAQKSAAVIFMLLLSTGSSGEGQIPFWAILGCSASLATGVPVGGWKIARILNGKTYNIKPAHSFASQLSAGVVLAAANLLGGFLSPNQLVKASFLGTGAGGRKEAPWRILGKSAVMAWLVHLPACALIAAAVHWCASRALGLGMGSLEAIMGGLGT